MISIERSHVIAASGQFWLLLAGVSGLPLLAPRAILGFSISRATHCTVSGVDVSWASRALRFASSLRIPPRSGWRVVATDVRIGRISCFRLVPRVLGLRVAIPLAVPGRAR